jgi:hypothetical protein
MAKVSKREQAFKLFDQGKKPGDPEIVALELSPKTVRKYKALWKKQASVAKTVPGGLDTELYATSENIINSYSVGEVVVESIPDGSLFEHKGLLYKKRKVVYSGQVIANRMVGAGYTSILRERDSAEFKPGVMVIPK